MNVYLKYNLLVVHTFVNFSFFLSFHHVLKSVYKLYIVVTVIIKRIDSCQRHLFLELSLNRPKKRILLQSKNET